MPKRPLDIDPSNIISTGKKRRLQIPLSSTKEYYQAPQYTACGTMCGGCKSTAVLGPRAYREVNSDADPSKPPGIADARKKYPKCAFKAGHLLNATFGGNGSDSKNLVILTSGANVRCNSFDNKVKEALIHLKHIYEALARYYVDIAQVDYGVKLEITVDKSKKWGTTAPDSYIHKVMFMKAAAYGTVDLTKLVDSAGDVLTLTETQKKDVNGHIAKFRTALAPMANFRVDNLP
ncbi:MAG TPA: hypothetical protein VME43_05720 [Bryobacteraceae bacterium]|nr:hypothetical protein [Bryobacteraceae bacterium]